MADSPARSDGSDMERLAKDAPRNILASGHKDTSQQAAFQAGSHGPTYVDAPDFVPAPHATPAPTPQPAPASTPPNLQAAIAQAFQAGLAAAAAPAAPAAGVPATIAVAAPTEPPACRYFAQGNCRRGAPWYRHQRP